jgi:predicted acylesterase/phospholipase RssA
VLKHKQYVPASCSLPPAWAALEVGDTVSVGLPDGSVMRGFVAQFAPPARSS